MYNLNSAADGDNHTQVSSVAEGVLAGYQAARFDNSIFYMFHRAPDRDIYEAQLQTLSALEKTGQVKPQEVMGLLLLIYLQVNADGNASSSDSLFSRVLSNFMPDSDHMDESSNSALAAVLDQVACQVPGDKGELKSVTLTQLADDRPHRSDYLVRAAAETSQAAHSRFSEQSIRVKGADLRFFTPAQNVSHAKLQEKLCGLPHKS